MLGQQVGETRLWLALTLTIAATTASVFLVVHYATSVNVEVLTVDPVAEVGLPSYVGVFSHLGVLVLCAAASISLFGWYLLRGSPAGTRLSLQLGILGLLLAWLAIDDLFLIHEEIGRVLADKRDRPEDRSLFEFPVFVFYGFAWVAWLVRFRREIAQTPFLLLGLGIAALALSMLIDIGEFVVPGVVEATPWMATTLNMAEELAKLLGVVLFFGYAVSTTVRRVQHIPAPRAVGDEVATGRGATRA